MTRKVKEIEREAKPGEDFERGNVLRPMSDEQTAAALEAKGWHTHPTAHQVAGASLSTNEHGDTMISVEPVRPKPVRRDPWRRPVLEYADRLRDLQAAIRRGE